MNLKFPQLAIATAALILLYSAIRDVNPRDVIVNTLQGKALPAAGSAGTGKPTGNTPIVGADGKPNGAKLDPNGGYLPPDDRTLPQPNAPKEHSTAYVTPYPSAPYQVTSV